MNLNEFEPAEGLADVGEAEPEEELIDIIELARELKITAATLAGVKAMTGWKKGAAVTRRDFEQAVQKFKEHIC